jgi:hypothetical protein
VQPLWEDRANCGSRLISIEHQIQNAKKPKISDRWTDVVLGLVGESIANSKMIKGVEFTVRKETYNIALWMAPIPNPLVDEIGKDLQKLVAWKSPIKIQPIDPAPPK